MLQFNHIYEFLRNELFNDFLFSHCINGVIEYTTTPSNIALFKPDAITSATQKIFCYDQEPVIPELSDNYLALYAPSNDPFTKSLIVSEKSQLVNEYAKKYNLNILYYFSHGFIALDWYRGYYTLNYSKPVNKSYQFDYISFNRLINNDRSYRCYYVSLLAEHGLLDKGQVSFGLDNEQGTWQSEIKDQFTKLSPNAIAHIKQYIPKSPLIIDSPNVPGWASADIPRSVNNSFWNIVTETVFYYDKLHLTEKIFKPIVSKQPFMLVGAPGNLAYLRSYGFKTFDGIIDESYDTILDNETRVEAVVAQIKWYTNLPASEKQRVIEAIAPIVDYNFHHFYGKFNEIIVDELLNNTKALFKQVGYNDSHISYNDIRKSLLL